MASKTFAIRTEPHEATIGNVVLCFVPETKGSDFVQAYAELRTIQATVIGKKTEDLDPESLALVSRALRAFLQNFMLPESAAVFSRFDVISNGTLVSSHLTEEEAAYAAASIASGADVVDRSMDLPDRVLIEMLEWVAGLYGGGAKERPTTSS